MLPLLLATSALLAPHQASRTRVASIAMSDVEKTTGPDVSLAASQAKAELRAAQSAAAAAWRNEEKTAELAAADRAALAALTQSGALAAIEAVRAALASSSLGTPRAFHVDPKDKDQWEAFVLGLPATLAKDLEYRKKVFVEVDKGTRALSDARGRIVTPRVFVSSPLAR